MFKLYPRIIINKWKLHIKAPRYNIFTDLTWYNSRVDLFVVDSAVIVYDTGNDEESLKIWIVL